MVKTLSGFVDSILAQHIKTVLPDLKSCASAQLTSVAKELAAYGDVVESKLQVHSSEVSVKVIVDFLSYLDVWSILLGAITSGELTHQFHLRRDDPWFAALGRRCIHMTWNDRRGNLSRGLGVVSRVDGVEFILAHGTEALGLSSDGSKSMDLEGLRQNLELCAKRTKPIPMVVANPDYVTVEARNLRMMPGHSTRITNTNAASMSIVNNYIFFISDGFSFPLCVLIELW
ncbi:uncharacterized protein LOC144561946 [Carex rostrata]